MQIHKPHAVRAEVSRRRAARLLPPAQPKVRHSQRKELPADLIYIVGQGIGQQGQQSVSKGCQQLDLRARIELPGCQPYGTVQAIKHWHRTGRLGQATHVTLDMHGRIADGKHWVLLPEGEWMETVELVRVLREGGREFGLQEWEGCIEFHVCFVGQLREYLENVAGLHLLCAGKSEVLTRLGWHVAMAVLPALKAQKDQPRVNWAQTLFEHVKQGAPMTVAMVGKGVATMLSHVRTPQDLIGRKVSMLDAFATRVLFGKADHVKVFIEKERALLKLPCGGHRSPFSAAVHLEKWEMVAMLLTYTDANWEQDLSALLKVAACFPGQARPFELSGLAFERKAMRMTAPVQTDPAQLRELVLELALDHMLRSLEDLESAVAPDLARELSQDGRSNPAFAVVWQLLARTGAAATRMCRLGFDDEAEDFRRELRQRLAMELLQGEAQSSSE